MTRPPLDEEFIRVTLEDLRATGDATICSGNPRDTPELLRVLRKLGATDDEMRRLRVLR